MRRLTLVAVVMASALFAQDAALERLQKEAVGVRKSALSDVRPITAQLAALHLALRDWIESRLPGNESKTLNTKGLENSMLAELSRAGLTAPGTPANGGPEGPGPGYAEFGFQSFPEMPHVLIVTAGISVGCGTDDAVYLYHFDQRARTRVFEDYPKTEWKHTFGGVELSAPDSHGRRLLLTRYTSVQCGSTWMGMAYSVNRLSSLGDARELLLSGDHSFWLQIDEPIVLKPDELIIELQDHSVDAAVHSRTEILRYNFADGVHRLDPVALQPQDFAEEWLTEPWSDMAPRSDPKTKEWHDRMHGDSVWAEYAGVIQCAERPGQWLIALDVNQIGEKELSEPLESYFLERDLGDYHYRMEAVSRTRPSGCPGDGLSSDAGPASDKHPWLSEEELKALR